MRNIKLYNRLLLLAILMLTLGFMTWGWIAPAFAEEAAVMESTPTATPAPSPTPTPETVITIEFIPTPSPVFDLTPAPTATPVVFVVKEFKMPRDIEVLWNKFLWYSPIRSENGADPNPKKIELLWVIINEYECSKVINSKGEVVEYGSLSTEDQRNNNFTWLFPKDFYELMMRQGDHDWFRNAMLTNQPWHESEVNDRVVHTVYNVWMSEREGLISGRTVPRNYLYYAFVPDHSGMKRDIALYTTKEDLQSGENAYTGFLKGTLDK